MLLVSVLSLRLLLPRSLYSWLVSFLIWAVSSELLLVSSLIVLIRLSMVSFFFLDRHCQGVKGLSNFFRHFFANLFLRLLVRNDGVVCEANLAGGELVQLLGVADSRAEVFLRWRPLTLQRGVFLPFEVLGVDEARGSELCLHLHDHLGLAYGYFDIRR